MTTNSHWLSWAALIITMLLTTPAYAIVNIEDSALAHPDSPYSATLDASVHGTSGNSDKVATSADLGVQWHRNAHQLLLWLGYDYGSSQKKRNANRGFAHLRYRYHCTPRYAIESFGQWQKDDFARLNSRILLGGGVRITQIKQHIGIGLFHEREQLQPSKTDRSNLNQSTWRGNIYLALQHQFDHATISDTLYYQPAIRASNNDYRLLNEASLKVPLSKNLSLKLALETRQDSQPPIGVKQTDMSYTTSFSYTLP
ncbi:MAG: DUF481 domain-containing protein [Mariprofundales bacterium]